MDPEQLATMWAHLEISTLHKAALEVAYYNKLIAEGAEEWQAWSLMQQFANHLNFTIFPQRSNQGE
jgi:hypothetical protein